METTREEFNARGNNGIYLNSIEQRMVEHIYEAISCDFKAWEEMKEIIEELYREETERDHATGETDATWVTQQIGDRACVVCSNLLSDIYNLADTPIRQLNLFFWDTFQEVKFNIDFRYELGSLLECLHMDSRYGEELNAEEV